MVMCIIPVLCWLLLTSSLEYHTDGHDTSICMHCVQAYVQQVFKSCLNTKQRTSGIYLLSRSFLWIRIAVYAHNLPRSEVPISYLTALFPLFSSSGNTQKRASVMLLFTLEPSWHDHCHQWTLRCPSVTCCIYIDLLESRARCELFHR